MSCCIDYSRLEWISFHGPRRPINGQEIYYYGEHFGVRKGKYRFMPDDPWSAHIIQSTECAGSCDRMDAPWWMPNLGQDRPEKPETPYPKDYPNYDRLAEGLEMGQEAVKASRQGLASSAESQG